jgi:flagellar biosynthetic protein FliR
VTGALEGTIGVAFVIFCRVGACIMVIPGFSSSRVPIRIRLYVAIGISLALTAPLIEVVKPVVSGATVTSLGSILLTELAVGLLIGFMARLFFFAIETLATAAVMAMGLGNILSAAVDEAEPLPAMSSFILLTATTLIFVLDQHWEVIRGLISSYTEIPVANTPSPRVMLSEYMRVLEQAFLLATRISSPFLLFGLIVNLAFGFLNRMTPQIPVYFISGPLLIVMGTYWFYVISDDFFAAFSIEFSSWLVKG